MVTHDFLFSLPPGESIYVVQNDGCWIYQRIKKNDGTFAYHQPGSILDGKVRGLPGLKHAFATLPDAKQEAIKRMAKRIDYLNSRIAQFRK